MRWLRIGCVVIVAWIAYATGAIDAMREKQARRDATKIAPAAIATPAPTLVPTLPQNPAQPPVPQLTLHVTTGQGSDAIAGPHRMRAARWSSDPGVVLACVPCFNSMTSIAVIDGMPYSANGITAGHHRRFSISSGDGMIAVRDGQQNHRITMDMIAELQRIPGCALPPGPVLDNLTAAMIRGRCLGN